MSVDISTWINSQDIRAKEFRQAIHTLLVAISCSKNLSTKMIMKGAILLAIEFQGSRYTKDIDFSTNEKAGEVSIHNIIADLSWNLLISIEKLPYDLDCKIQSWELKPQSDEATYPTLKIKIGYAYKGTKKHDKLKAKMCPTVLEVDYSFNESNIKIDTIELMDGTQVKAYSLPDLIAEKYRAILQQEERNRFRRQDPYDIYCLKQNGFMDDAELPPKILTSLIMKARSRGIEANKTSMRNTEIIRRARQEYPTLQDEITGELPPFDEVYGVALEYYESLPWI